MEQSSEGKTVVWSAYFPDSDQARVFQEGLARIARERALNLQISAPQIIRRENWHEGWRQYFRPVRVTDRILIAPPWASGSAMDNHGVQIIIEPGMAFGTGTHETTQMCLRLIERLMPPQARVLDAGTGSGILGIAAVKLGASQVIGFDLDADAAGNLRENLALNHVPKAAFYAVVGPLEAIAQRPPFDVVICNMLSREFLPLLPRLEQYLAPGGLLLLSGYLDSEADEVEEAVASAHMRIFARDGAGEWRALAGRRV